MGKESLCGFWSLTPCFFSLPSRFSSPLAYCTILFMKLFLHWKVEWCLGGNFFLFIFEAHLLRLPLLCHNEPSVLPLATCTQQKTMDLRTIFLDNFLLTYCDLSLSGFRGGHFVFLLFLGIWWCVHLLGWFGHISAFVSRLLHTPTFEGPVVCGHLQLFAQLSCQTELDEEGMMDIENPGSHHCHAPKFLVFLFVQVSCVYYKTWPKMTSQKIWFFLPHLFLPDNATF